MIEATLLLFLLLACTSDDGKPGDDSGSGHTDTDPDDSSPTNQPPSAPEVAITPANPGPGADLLATVVSTSVDPEGDAVSYRYLWQQNGGDQADLTTETVPASRTEDGDTWRVVVTPNDGELDGDPGEATVTISNLPPDAPIVHIEPAAPVPGDTLTFIWDATPSDPNGDPVTTVIKWYKNNSYVVNWDDLTTIEGVYATGGDNFRAEVTVSDGSLSTTDSTEVDVANTPPVITSVVIVPPDPVDADELRVQVEADDEDGGTLRYRYVWYRDGAEATDVGDSSSVDPVYTTPGEVWDLEVFVSDPAAEVSMRASEPKTIIPFDGFKMTELYTVTLEPDGSGGWTNPVGYWEAELLSYGASGDNDCNVNWDFTAVENTARCPTCDFAFSATYVYDTASTITTGCADAPYDARGYFTFDIDLDQFIGYMTDAFVAPETTATNMQLRLTGDGTTYTSGTGYVRYSRYSTNYSYDGDGNITIEAYRYRYETE